MSGKPRATSLRLDDALAAETPSFSDGLICTLELSSPTQPTPIVVNGHNIVSFTLDLSRSGFVGELSFKMDEVAAVGSAPTDLLIALFRTPQLLQIKMSLKPAHVSGDADPSSAAIVPLEVQGLVMEKSLIERTAQHREGAPLSFRIYYVRFADPAQVLWHQHFPFALYTQAALQDVITQNSNEFISVSFVDTTMAAIKPFIFVGLDVRNRPDERASFYDFVMWQLDMSGRMWIYDYPTKAYQVHKTKLPPVAVAVPADDINEIFTYYPAPPRGGEALLNDYTEQVQNQPVVPTDPLVLPNLVTGVRKDIVFNTSIATEFDQALLQLNEGFYQLLPEFVLRYRLFPSAPYAPGVGVDFLTNQLDFQSETVAIPVEALLELGRVFRVSLHGVSEETDVRQVYDGKVPGRFACRVNVWVEAASNPTRRLPKYIQPRYPIYIEGKVSSEVGQPLDETYQFYPDPVTFINNYKITIPLWANQIITVPFNPNMDPGHFYFPAYKGERVLIAFYYDRAQLKRFLDWRPTAQLPLESQGDQLLMGKTPTNRTAVRHTYQNELPVFEIERLNLLTTCDTERLKIGEGNLLLEVGTPLGVPPPGVSENIKPPKQNSEG